MKNYKNNYLRIGLVAGTKGIGQAHIREFLNFGLEKVGLYGKTFNRNRVKKIKFEKKKSQKIYNLKNYNEIRKFKPRVVSICTPTELHSKHIYTFSKISKNLLVEKPLTWKDNLDNYLIAKKIFKLKNNLIVNLPMINLASQIYSREKIKKITKINFDYYTNGKQTYKNIPVDLLPHALSFCITILKKNEISYKIVSVNQEKTSWNCEIYLNNCKCQFKLRQNKNQKISKLSFKLNNSVYFRKQVKTDNNYKNLIIKNKKKIIKIKNPMSEYILRSLKNFHNKKYVNSNNKLVLLITKITQDLVNYKIK